MRDVYVPVRSHPLAFLNDKACLGTLSCLALVLLLSAQQKPPAGVIPVILVATGFLITYFIQGKFFPYHIFPAALFAAIAASILVYRRVVSYAAGPAVRLAAARGFMAWHLPEYQFFSSSDLTTAGRPCRICHGLQRLTGPPLSPFLQTSPQRFRWRDA